MIVDNRVPKIIENHHYGDETRWWFGVCISDQDPEMLGRIQVRIYGIHSKNVVDVPTAVLPWAQCLIPSTEGGVSGMGGLSRILPGAQVFGIFLDGKNSQIPFVFGSVHHKESGGIDQESPSRAFAERQDRLFDPRGPHQLAGYSFDVPTERIDEALIGSNASEKIYNFFTSSAGGNFTPAQSSGIIGNFYGESTLNPTALNPNDKGAPAYGLAQWRADRYEGLIDYSQRVGLDYTTMTAQLNYVNYELATSERRAAGKLRLASTPREAAVAFCRYYERPEYTITNGVYSSPNLSTRVDVAIETYRKFGT